MLPGPPRECVALTAKRGLGGARRTPAPVSRAARRPYIIHCQTGPRAACAGGSLCAWHLADCSSHVASLPLHGFAGCDPSPCLPGGGGPEVQRMGRLAFSSQQGLKATGLDPAALSHLLTMEGRDSPGEGLGGDKPKVPSCGLCQHAGNRQFWNFPLCLVADGPYKQKPVVCLLSLLHKMKIVLHLLYRNVMKQIQYFITL